MSRLITLLAILFLTTGCIGANVNDDKEKARTPEARSTVGGVETWDLTGTPSVAAFDIRKGEHAAIYETDDPRMVHYRLPSGRTLEVETRFIDFTRTTGEGGAFTWSLRTPELTGPEMVSRLRDILDQLGLPATSADELARKLETTPEDSFERIIVQSDTVDLGTMTVGASATISPSAGKGRLDVSAVWK